MILKSAKRKDSNVYLQYTTTWGMNWQQVVGIGAQIYKDMEDLDILEVRDDIKEKGISKIQDIKENNNFYKELKDEKAALVIAGKSESYNINMKFLIFNNTNNINIVVEDPGKFVFPEETDYRELDTYLNNIEIIVESAIRFSYISESAWKDYAYWYINKIIYNIPEIYVLGEPESVSPDGKCDILISEEENFGKTIRIFSDYKLAKEAAEHYDIKDDNGPVIAVIERNDNYNSFFLTAEDKNIDTFIFNDGDNFYGFTPSSFNKQNKLYLKGEDYPKDFVKYNIKRAE